MYAHGFRFYFTPLAGVLFAFPSRYWFTIGRQVVFSLGGWSPRLQTEYHVFRLTHVSSMHRLRVREFHPLRCRFPPASTCTASTFGLFPVRSPLLRKSRLISFPRGTEMFHFPRFASASYDADDSCSCQVSLFGYLRINAPYRLPSAFRRLARPSSPPDARASAMCAFLLDHTAKRHFAVLLELSSAILISNLP